MSRRNWMKDRRRRERSLGISKHDPAGRWLRENDPAESAKRDRQKGPRRPQDRS
jgi:hypothetical protein